MFEHETDVVRLGIEFLEALMEKDYREVPDFDPVDLKKKLKEIEGDIDTLVSNLPYEAIDDNEEMEHQYPEEFADNEELEDEVVECDKVIARARALLEGVRERYFGDQPLDPAIEAITGESSEKKPMSTQHAPSIPESKKKRYINWANVFWIAVLIGLVVLIALL